MQKNEPVKLVIDTNLWVSFVISNRQNILDSLLYSSKIRILFSIELIEEIRTTIEKPKLQKYFTHNALEEMLTALDAFIDLIEVKSIVSVCRDVKDNFLLALCEDGKADYLVTGDKDLLVLEKHGTTKMITIVNFISIINE